MVITLAVAVVEVMLELTVDLAVLVVEVGEHFSVHSLVALLLLELLIQAQVVTLAVLELSLFVILNT
jgi:hypothetical protein